MSKQPTPVFLPREPQELRGLVGCRLRGRTESDTTERLHFHFSLSFSRGSSRPRDWTQVSHIAGRRFNLCATREALKYKNTASEKTSCRDTELQIQALTSKISKGGKEARLKEKGGGGRRGGAKVPQHNYYYKSEIYEISSK